MCTHCGSYLYVDDDDDHYDYPADGDSTDSGEDEHYEPDHTDAPNMTAQDLKDTYMWARREFRKKTGRFPRHHRFPRRGEGHGKYSGPRKG
jgi:hypothetical protein